MDMTSCSVVLGSQQHAVVPGLSHLLSEASVMYAMSLPQLTVSELPDTQRRNWGTVVEHVSFPSPRRPALVEVARLSECQGYSDPPRVNVRVM